MTDTSVRSTLPRQDDLQGMVDWERYELYFWKGAKLWLLVELMTEDYETLENRRHLFSGDSMESLWLQFVMWEKYGTVWNAADQHWQPAKITAHVTL